MKRPAIIERPSAGETVLLALVTLTLGGCYASWYEVRVKDTREVRISQEEAGKPRAILPAGPHGTAGVVATDSKQVDPIAVHRSGDAINVTARDSSKAALTLVARQGARDLDPRVASWSTAKPPDGEGGSEGALHARATYRYRVDLVERPTTVWKETCRDVYERDSFTGQLKTERECTAQPERGTVLEGVAREAQLALQTPWSNVSHINHVSSAKREHDEWQFFFGGAVALAAGVGLAILPAVDPDHTGLYLGLGIPLIAFGAGYLVRGFLSRYQPRKMTLVYPTGP